MSNSSSCRIPVNDPLFTHYHDCEWGVPVTDDQRLFEKVCLEGFQSGLSWQTILHRREAFRQCFNHFDLATVSNYTESDVERLAGDIRIIRNRRKIRSAINNAQRALDLKAEFGTLARFFWNFEPDPLTRPSLVTQQWLSDNPYTEQSTALSRDLKQRGWSFTGPTNMYALMQAVGIVNDHVHSCPVREHIDQLRASTTRP